MRIKKGAPAVFLSTFLLCIIFIAGIPVTAQHTLTALGVVYGSQPPAAASGSEKKSVSKKLPQSQSQTLRVHFLSLDHGDCILLTCGGESMMIDFGEARHAVQILDYLHQAGIKRLKYAVCTHPHPDHIGGMPQVLTEIEADHVLIPDIRKNYNYYQQVLSICTGRLVPVEHPVPGTTLTLGDAVLTVLSPVPGQKYGNMNDYSIVMRLMHGQNSFLFTGDLLRTGEKRLLKTGFPLRAKVLKACHHGKNSSSTKAFLKKVKPSWAVVTCGSSLAGHPGRHALKRLRNSGAILYRTDKLGTVVCSSNGSRLKWTPTIRHLNTIRKK